MRALAGCLLFVAFGVFECLSQTGDHAPTGSSDLSSLAAEEGKRGIYLFYTQSFVDKENKKASYRGSLYGAIQKFELKGCELEVEAVIVDKFAGTVGNSPTGELEDTYRYSARLFLTGEISGGLAVIQARPSQLGRTTHSVCDEDSSCSFPWLRFQAKQKVMHETSTVNDSLYFQGQVDHFVVPISSSDVGKRMIEELRTMTASHCR